MTTVAVERRLALEYARICDDRDFPAMRAIITDDFSQQGPQWGCNGAQAFIDQLQVLEDEFSATLHMVGNQIGNWDGDHYRGETYCIATHIYDKDGVSRKMEMGIRYQDVIDASGSGHRYRSRDLKIVWAGDTPLNA